MKWYLLGASVWQSLKIGKPRELYDFMGQDSTGMLMFQHRKSKFKIAFSYEQLYKSEGFRPFLINMDLLGRGKLVVKDGE